MLNILKGDAHVNSFPAGGPERHKTHVDVEEAEKFLALLDPDQDVFLFSSFDDDKERAKLMRAKKIDGVPGSEKLSTLCGALAWMNKRQALGANVCCAVQAMRGRKRTLESVVGYRAIFAEMDQPSTHPWPLKPSIIVESSPDRFHFYWLIDSETPMDGDTFEGVEKRIVLGYGADNGAKDRARTLRLPGSWNLKKGRAPWQVKIVDESGYRYTAAELVEAFPPVQKAPPSITARPDFSRHSAHGDLGRFVEPLNRISPEDYQTWLEIGMALHAESGGSSEGLLAWDAWSASSTKWSEGECEYRWNTFRAGRGVTGGTVFHTAELNGYKKPDRPAKRQTRAKKAFAGETIYSPPPPKANVFIIWPDLDQNGNPTSRSQPNIEAFLRNVGVELAYNSFSCRNIVRRSGSEEVLDDALIRSLWLQADRMGMKANEKYFYAVIFNICHAAPFNPVVDFLDGLSWDGVPRLDRWMSRYLGARDTVLSRAQGAIHLIAAVRRARRPGSKHDVAIVLEGPQGGGKSTAIRKLAGDDWFTDGLNIGDDAKVVLEQTADSWIVELAELAGIGKRDVESVKSFLSRTHDSSRLSYDRCTTRRGRKFICFATTNSSDYLIDKTGNRRFWPIQVGSIDIPAIEQDRVQIWAEAAAREAKGESTVLPPELWEAAALEQAARVQVDPWQEALEESIGGRCGKVAVSAIWQALSMDSKSQNPALGKRIADIMVSLGFKKDKQRKNGQLVNCYSRISPTGETPWFTL